jgi:hypothetical protein
MSSGGKKIFLEEPDLSDALLVSTSDSATSTIWVNNISPDISTSNLNNNNRALIEETNIVDTRLTQTDSFLLNSKPKDSMCRTFLNHGSSIVGIGDTITATQRFLVNGNIAISYKGYSISSGVKYELYTGTGVNILYNTSTLLLQGSAYSNPTLDYKFDGTSAGLVYIWNSGWSQPLWNLLIQRSSILNVV